MDDCTQIFPRGTFQGFRVVYKGSFTKTQSMPPFMPFYGIIFFSYLIFAPFPASRAPFPFTPHLHLRRIERSHTINNIYTFST